MNFEDPEEQLQDGMATPFDPEAVAPYCESKKFRAGDTLRHRGKYYRNLFLITDGIVEVRVAPYGRELDLIECKAGSPIGEIGFLRGCPATANVVAKTDVSVFAISDADLYVIEERDPELAVRLSRFLGATLEERVDGDQQLADLSGALAKPQGVEIVMCRSDNMLEEAQRLRYRVYCDELGRQSPHADHTAKTIRDDFDDFGQTFLAIRSGETVGTIRGNVSNEGQLGLLEDLYGMSASRFHPEKTCIATKFIVSKSERGGGVDLNLCAAVVGYAIEQELREAYIDCIPRLLPYYKFMRFKVTAEKFLHYENGPSYPMVLDLKRDGRRLTDGFGP